MKAKATKAILEWKKGIDLILNEGMVNGEFSKYIDVRRISLSMVSLLEGEVLLMKTTGSNSFEDRILETISLMVSQLKSSSS